MAAVGARPVLYQYHHAGDDALSSMSSYFSQGGSSTSSSSASSFSAALAPAPIPPPIGAAADPGAAQFDISEYLFDDVAQGVFGAAPDAPPPAQHVVQAPDSGAAAAGAGAAAAQNARSAAEAMPERPRTERIAFRTKSEIEILDDGYKWRKYGKKSVKNSPNPRNYYRCSTEGCNVKKRVERDKDDPAYVVTTYEGTHNHVSPSTVYYASQDAASGRFFVAGTQPPGSLN
ncbi:hypothetical protein QOZ80_5AG0365210 [Eleusine coracana subsp. coracana]|nr:hypothetical protein QOZ80_5AG0365190 [Eleusine coracana subsp. coracana]KAK3138151.1 hypothetical protein QOZ80_5AG0365200 [Eleusine coracana subsp. coracana]KAK3138152.1 hypothetical protein QOZ80_5AG0365210 [Eleusine coracana subsp. coracana]